MEFLTIHELSRQFDTPARVIRYRFHKLRQVGKLAEDQDYRRDDLVDDQHFEWKINPVSFMRAAGMTLAATGPASALGNSTAMTKIKHAPGDDHDWIFQCGNTPISDGYMSATPEAGRWSRSLAADGAACIFATVADSSLTKRPLIL